MSPCDTCTGVATGPLRVHPRNPRYFTDGGGRAIYLTGSHCWQSLQDLSDRPPFDYAAYLDMLQEHGHNFMRMWAWEGGESVAGQDLGPIFSPMPYRRTGPGTALDGQPKYDLTQWDPAYFERLRSRVSAARDRGIYVSVMLFQGWSIERKKSHRSNPWPAHPFNRENNINGIDGDADGDGEGKDVHTLSVPAVTRLQEAYVRQIVDTVNDLDNVLYEITNESPIMTADWQYYVVHMIHLYESTKPKQHPVGMSSFWFARAGAMNALYAGPADWIAPCNDGHCFHYDTDPPAADGRKVILNDTDHTYGVGGDQKWVWKTFARGQHPVFMDPFQTTLFGDPARWEPARLAMGQTRQLAERMDLAAMLPRGDMASSEYSLVHPGQEYLVYLPEGGEVTVDLTAAKGSLTVEWIHPINGPAPGKGLVAGGAHRLFAAPFVGDAVLYLKAQAE